MGILVFLNMESEIRAMEHEGKLSIINREGLVDREIYSPGNLKNSRPVF